MTSFSAWSIDQSRSDLDPLQWHVYRARAANGSWEYDVRQFSKAAHAE